MPEFNHYQDNPPPSRRRRTRRPLRSRPVARLDTDENEEDESGW